MTNDCCELATASAGLGHSPDCPFMEKWNQRPLLHICEVCGKTETMTTDVAFDQGWDYPPRMGVFKILSPRTCGDCGIEKTLYWRLITTPEYLRNSYNLTDEEHTFLQRVLHEPMSITPGAPVGDDERASDDQVQEQGERSPEGPHQDTGEAPEQEHTS